MDRRKGSPCCAPIASSRTSSIDGGLGASRECALLGRFGKRAPALSKGSARAVALRRKERGEGGLRYDTTAAL
jgi:hypothetical protein